MQKQPSLFKILINDYPSFMSIMFPVVTWGIYLYFLLSDRSDLPDSSLPIVFGIITALSVICLAWRIILIHSVFADGIEVSATISNVYFYRDRGRILFAYTYMGEKYNSGNLVAKWKQTRAFERGMETVVVIDGNHPKRAFIRDLFS